MNAHNRKIAQLLKRSGLPREKTLADLRAGSIAEEGPFLAADFVRRELPFPGRKHPGLWKSGDRQNPPSLRHRP